LRSRWSAHAGLWSAVVAFTLVAASASSFAAPLSSTVAGGRSASGVSLASLRGATGSDLRFVERNGIVYVVDPLTGERSRLGTSDLVVVGSTELGDGRTVQVAWSEGAAYAIDTKRGLVQPIDPDTLKPTGPAMQLGKNLTNGLVDGNMLWVASNDSGYVYGLKGRSSLELVDSGKVAARGENLTMRLNDGSAEVVNLDTKVVVPADSGARQAVIDGMLGTGNGSGELAGAISSGGSRTVTSAPVIPLA